MADGRREIEDALRSSFLFPLLDPAERDRFIAAARSRSWPAGATIFSLDEPGSSMVLVRTGFVRIGYPSPEGRSLVLAELGPGSVFGEIALLDGGPRSADAIAATDCTLLVFERRDFLPMLERNWRLAEAVLQESDELISNGVVDEPLALPTLHAVLEHAQIALLRGLGLAGPEEGATLD